MEKPEDTLEMQEKRTYQLLPVAEGTIEATGEQLEIIDEFTAELVSGEYYVEIDDKIFKICMDGREGGFLAPNSAGGTMTFVVAEDLTTARFAGEKGTLKEGFEAASTFLKTKSISAGIHGDDKNLEGKSLAVPIEGHVHNPNCGCGAIDKIEKIYSTIVDKADVLFEFAKKLGLNPSEEHHKKIIVHAASRADFSTGIEIAKTSEKINGAESVTVLKGQHKEVAAVINMVKGTTLDRTLIQAKHGDTVQSFNIDGWAIEPSAELISADVDELEWKKLAMFYYNVAAAMVLCGKGMRVIVRSE